MLFNSLQYAVFLPIVLGAYWLVRRTRPQNWLLLVASYVFYGAWDYRFLSLLVISTVADYVIGRRMGASQNERRRKALLTTSLAINLGILGFFKYYGFFVDSAIDLLQDVGLRPNPPLLQIVLPVGISFYTFQTISYTFDVYRRRIEPTRSLLNFGVYVAFFPQLVAGPIERARHLLPQIERARRVGWEDLKSGSLLILLGLFKKVAIADVMATVADEAFSTVERASTTMLVIGVYAFALQIYGDFSGYTDIARGTARLFGIELMENFHQPYLSRNIAQFWRTWHISLSNWLWDYLYIPLGGNRKGTFNTYRNLMITMILGGLWHGASWTFVVWGALHGAFLAVHRRFGTRVPRGYQGRFTARDILPAIGTFHLVGLGWIFFRAESISVAIEYLGGILALRGRVPDGRFLVLLIPATLIVFALDVWQRNRDDETFILNWAPVARGLTYGLMVLAIIVFSGAPVTPFIYFQF